VVASNTVAVLEQVVVVHGVVHVAVVASKSTPCGRRKGPATAASQPQGWGVRSRDCYIRRSLVDDKAARVRDVELLVKPRAKATVHAYFPRSGNGWTHESVVNRHFVSNRIHFQEAT